MSLKLTSWCGRCNDSKKINIPVKSFFDKNAKYIGTFDNQIDFFMYTCQKCQSFVYLSITDEKLDEKIIQYVIKCFKK